MINEDTQGNVRQLQSEVKKLKEQLALFTSGKSVNDISLPSGNFFSFFVFVSLSFPPTPKKENLVLFSINWVFDSSYAYIMPIPILYF